MKMCASTFGRWLTQSVTFMESTIIKVPIHVCVGISNIYTCISSLQKTGDIHENVCKYIWKVAYSKCYIYGVYLYLMENRV